MDVKGGAVKRKLLVLRQSVQGRRQHSVSHLERRLGQGGYSSGGFQVADVGFHRPDGAEAAPLRALPVGIDQSGDFYGVPEWRACSVGFDITDGFRGYPRVIEGVEDDAGLRVGVGRGVSARPSTGVDGGPPDDGVYPVSVFDRLVERLEEDRANALAVYESVGPLAKAPANAFPGEHLRPAEPRKMHGVQDEVHPARDGGPALSAADRSTCEVYCRKRRGAGGVHRDAWPLKVENVGNSVGNGPEGGHRLATDAARVRRPGEPLVVAVHRADENADPVVFTGKAPPRVTRIFQRLPCDLQEKPLLGVHLHRFRWGNIEEERVEPVHAFDESAHLAVRFADGVRERAMEPPPVPPVGWNFPKRAASGFEVFPEIPERGRSRIPSGHADDGDAPALPFRIGCTGVFPRRAPWGRPPVGRAMRGRSARLPVRGISRRLPYGCIVLRREGPFQQIPF